MHVQGVNYKNKVSFIAVQIELRHKNKIKAQFVLLSKLNSSKTHLKGKSFHARYTDVKTKAK